MSDDNPYEILDIDPSLPLEELTELLRERAEELPPDERRVIQGLWQKLTVHPRDRLRHALSARPRDARPQDVERLARLIRRPAPEPEHRPEALLGRVTPLDLLVLPRYGDDAPHPDTIPAAERPLSRDPFFADDDP